MCVCVSVFYGLNQLLGLYGARVVVMSKKLGRWIEEAREGEREIIVEKKSQGDGYTMITHRLTTALKTQSTHTHYCYHITHTQLSVTNLCSLLIGGTDANM